MKSLMIHLLIVTSAGLVLYMKRGNREIKFSVVILICGIFFYSSLGMLTAYRSVEPPADDSRKIWIEGCLALQDVLSSQFLPVVWIYGAGLAVLALIPVVKK